MAKIGLRQAKDDPKAVEKLVKMMKSSPVKTMKAVKAVKASPAKGVLVITVPVGNLPSHRIPAYLVEALASLETRRVEAAGWLIWSAPSRIAKEVTVEQVRF